MRIPHTFVIGPYFEYLAYGSECGLAHANWIHALKNVLQSSSVLRQPRKRRPTNDYFTASVNLSMLPRRSSNRLRRKQAEHTADYSHLPPKFKGPLSPSMHFCHYVLEQLMSARYEPINWLIDLATVKKKLDYRQFEDSDEFAVEIRSVGGSNLQIRWQKVLLTHSKGFRFA
ncbi:unnamed protein product [Cylicostephanus goldi]|uniref:Uncharacterized protein n=1 Tax=Cylicostephanus goldi TaxID=71465 RepID=A0A3P7NY57_CYLGO|nr:unnamed protein product [Cylicostephanus goldi]